MLAAWIREARVRSQVRGMWCRYCRRQPRVLQADGDDRYCSSYCQEADWEDQAHA